MEFTVGGDRYILVHATPADGHSMERKIDVPAASSLMPALSSTVACRIPFAVLGVLWLGASRRRPAGPPGPASGGSRSA